MTQLMNALKRQFDSPRDVCRALGIDEKVLGYREPPFGYDSVPFPTFPAPRAPRLTDLFAKDASLADVMEFIDAVKGGGAANQPAVAQADEYEDDEDDQDDQDDRYDDDDDEVAADAEGGDDKTAKLQALLAQLQELIGGEAGGLEAVGHDDDDSLGPDFPSSSQQRGSVGSGYPEVTQGGQPRPGGGKDIGYGVVPKPAVFAGDAAHSRGFNKMFPGAARIALDGVVAITASSSLSERQKQAARLNAKQIPYGPGFIAVQPQPAARTSARIAQDAAATAATSDFHKRFPDAARIGLGPI